jgi:hypothetical protein
MKTLGLAVLAGTLLLALSACAAGSTDAHAAAAGGVIPEFFLGLWHGLIAPITLIAEIINWLLPHVLPWQPKFFETGAGVAYDIGFFITVSGGPHIIIHGRRRFARR